MAPEDGLNPSDAIPDVGVRILLLAMLVVLLLGIVLDDCGMGWE